MVKMDNGQSKAKRKSCGWQSTWWESHGRGQKNRLARRHKGTFALFRKLYPMEPLMGQRTILRRADVVKVKNQGRLVTQFKRCSRSEKQHGNMSPWPKEEMCMFSACVVALERWEDQMWLITLTAAPVCWDHGVKHLYVTQSSAWHNLKLNKGDFANVAGQ